jgi:hypothetical protein
MTVPRPTITSEGKAALDAHLEATVAEGSLPALFFAMYNADGPVYSACKGAKNLGQAEQVDEDTGECAEIRTKA